MGLKDKIQKAQRRAAKIADKAARQTDKTQGEKKLRKDLDSSDRSAEQRKAGRRPQNVNQVRQRDKFVKLHGRDHIDD